ncbi:MAG: sodium-dependent transporter [Bacteroidales bacterium]
MSERALFATKIGVIASTVGSAVGLGNIWRFPYLTGQNGGAAFLITYILCVMLLGIPLMISEFIVGRKAKANASRAFLVLQPSSHWNIIGYLGIFSSVIILGFYMVVSGWVTDYMIQSFGNEFIGKSSIQLSKSFEGFVSDPFRPLMWVYIFLFINYIILSQGVTKGIERASNILMPLLFIILIIFCINSLTMPGAGQGIEYLFKPDFSKITGKVFLDALGQAFFSLSIGIGILITYGSYFKPNTNLTSIALTVALLDVFIAILAGVIIFPATFSFGINPTQGPELIFITLPNVLQRMASPHLWSVLFFVLVGVAALTSTISLCEVAIAYIHEEFSLTRKKATLTLILIVALLSTLCSLSFSTLSDFKIFGMTFFDLSDYISANILLPAGGLLLSIFVGWKLKAKTIYRELVTKNRVPRWVFYTIIFCIRYIAPISIILIFLTSTGIFKL